MNTYTGTRDLWDAISKINFNEPVEPDSIEYVDTIEARYGFTADKFKKTLGIDPENNSLRAMKQKAHYLFTGHLGCGKSTELRKLVSDIDSEEGFFLVFMDSESQLDLNNLRYTDVLFALAELLVEKLRDQEVKIPQTLLVPLEDWFKQRVITEAVSNEFKTEIEAGVTGKSGLPFLFEAFLKVRSKITGGASYKNELRQTISNNFSQFKDAFEALIVAAENELQKNYGNRKILFVIDGTDRLDTDDTEKFFVGNIHQLTQINSNFIYACRIDMTERIDAKYFDHMFELPMIMLYKENGERNELGWSVLRSIIGNRVHPEMFDSEVTFELLVENSGGHPRHALSILRNAITNSEMDVITEANVKRAVASFSRDLQRLLKVEHYDLLVQADQSVLRDHKEETGYLLRNLLLLQYNEYFWRSHPAVRNLKGYEDAEARNIRIGP